MNSIRECCKSICFDCQVTFLYRCLAELAYFELVIGERNCGRDSRELRQSEPIQ